MKMHRNGSQRMLRVALDIFARQCAMFHTFAAILAGALVAVGLTAHASGATIVSTGFEASETPTYTNGAQLATVAGWNGDGQDTTGWTISSSFVGGSAAESGSQYVLVSSPTAATPAHFQWQSQPVTDFSVDSVVTGTAGVKLVSPLTGTVDRSTVAGVAIYDAAGTEDAELDVFNDIQNVEGGTAASWYIAQFFQDGTGYIHTLTGAPVNTYFDLSISIDYSTGIVTDSVDGTPLPETDTTTATDFHDFDMLTARTASTSGGTANRGGFDNYSVVTSVSVPEPTLLGLMGVAAAAMLGRRRRI
jgi:hypothetical protein